MKIVAPLAAIAVFVLRRICPKRGRPEPERPLVAERRSSMPRRWIRFAAAGLLAMLTVGGTSFCGPRDEFRAAGSVRRADGSVRSRAAATPAAPTAGAQAQPPASGQPPAASQTPAAAAPATAAQPSAGPAATPPPAAPNAAKPAESEKPNAEGSTGETVDLVPRPFVYIEGKAGSRRDFHRHSGLAGPGQARDGQGGSETRRPAAGRVRRSRTTPAFAIMPAIRSRRRRTARRACRTR